VRGDAAEAVSTNAVSTAVVALTKSPSVLTSGLQKTLDAAANRYQAQVPLIFRESLSHNVRLLRFGLDSPFHTLGLTVGQHVITSARVDGKMVMRSYTPVSLVHQRGYFDMVVKVYPGGKMSNHLDSLTVGSTLTIKGPSGRIRYVADGEFVIAGQSVAVSRLGLVCGGTGIAPMLQLMQAIDEEWSAGKIGKLKSVVLIDCNHSGDDILLIDAIARLCKRCPIFKCWHVLSNPDCTPLSNCGCSVGRLNADILTCQLGCGGDSDHYMFACVPPAMMQNAIVPFAKAIGFDESHLIEY
jgi:nitrate reductase (NAD(P)H)